MNSTFVVVGGGIAGVSCVEQLSQICEKETITFITARDVVKAAHNLKTYGRTLEEFDVKEQSANSVFNHCPNVVIVQSQVVAFNPEEHWILTDKDEKFVYKKLCICTGGRPNIISKSPFVVGIRDTESVQQLKDKLSKARRVVIVGNGGIALELVYELYGCQVLWAIKDDAIGNAFFDKGAATFFLPHLESNLPVAMANQKCMASYVKKMKYGIETSLSSVSQHSSASSDSTQTLCGGALGPDWSSGLTLCDINSEKEAKRQVYVRYNCEVKHLIDPQELKQSNQNEAFSPWHETTGKESADLPDWPVYVQLTNDEIYGCDLIVSATGVIPNTQPFASCAPFHIADDRGLLVDSNMQTNVVDVYAAGDVCSTGWNPAPCWFQMRLWSQARQMGVFAAKCMMAHLSNEQISTDFCFELFTHVTQFFGYKVVLLGKYNAQGLGSDHELLVRCTKAVEYVKIVLHRGKMCGAVLIGETELEETFENLILNEMDLTLLRDHLLDPDIDIEDYFD